MNENHRKELKMRNTTCLKLTFVSLLIGTAASPVPGEAAAQTAENVSTVDNQTGASPPNTSFTYRPNLLNTGVLLRFNSSNATNTTYEWDWTSDNRTDATGAAARHTYKKPGNYTVTLTVTRGGEKYTGNRTLNVERGEFDDVLPLDTGKNTVSVEVENESYMYVEAEKIFDLENTCVEPEEDIEGVGCPIEGGELDMFLEFDAFLDDNRNLEHDQGETLERNVTTEKRLEDRTGEPMKFAPGTYTLVFNWTFVDHPENNLAQTDTAEYNYTVRLEATGDDTTDGGTGDNGTDGNNTDGGTGDNSTDGNTTDGDTTDGSGGGSGTSSGSSVIESSGSGGDSGTGSLFVNISNGSAPLEDATVTVTDGNRNVRTGETGEKGDASFSLNDGSYTVNVTLEGYISEETGVEVEVQEVTAASFTLEPREEEESLNDTENSTAEDPVENDSAEEPDIVIGNDSTPSTPLGAFTGGASSLWLAVFLLLLAALGYWKREVIVGAFG